MSTEGAELWREGHNARKNQLSDAEFQTNLETINGNIQGLQSKLATVDPSSTEYAQTKIALAQALDNRSALFHPANHPNALEKFGHLLIPGGKPAFAPVARTVSQVPSMSFGGVTLPAGPATIVTGPQTPAQAKSMAEANQIAAATPYNEQNPYLKQKQQLREAGFNDEQIEKALGIFSGIEPKPTAQKPVNLRTDGKPYKAADGKYYRSVFNPATGEETVEAMDDNYVPPASTAKPIRAWTRNKSGKVISVLLDPATNQVVPGSEDESVLPPVGMIPKISTGQYHWTDIDGNVHATAESRTSQPNFSAVNASPGEGGAAAAIAPTPGTLKKKAAKSAPPTANGTPKGDRILGQKANAASNAADKDYVAATKLSSLADQALAPNPDGTVGQAGTDKQLALAIIRTMAGRVNMQEYDILTRKAGLGNSLEAWANSATSGKLPDDIRNQLVREAHNNLTAASAARSASRNPTPAKQSANEMTDDEFLKNFQ